MPGAHDEQANTDVGSNPGPLREGYGYYRDSPNGVTAGAGWSNGKAETGENVSELWASGGAGEWVDQNGKTNKGVAIEGGMAKIGEDLGDGPMGLGWDFGAGTVQAGATTNDSTTSIGAGANMVEGSVTMGSEEENVRLGLSAGGGMGGRLHHGDADGDGVMEAGFGVDYGFGSFDVKSETIGSAVNYIQEADLPGAWW